jgi:hypothetical protein
MESAAGMLEAVVHGHDDVEVAQARPTLPLGNTPIDLVISCFLDHVYVILKDVKCADNVLGKLSLSKTFIL